LRPPDDGKDKSGIKFKEKNLPDCDDKGGGNIHRVVGIQLEPDEGKNV